MGDDVPEDYEVLGAPAPSAAPLWLDPRILKLSHRVGRGPFGDAWLATIHSSTQDFDEFHEVAIKMLPDAPERVPALLQRFQATYQHAAAVKGVAWPQGITIKNGRACIVTKFFEGSLGDKVAHLPGNKLPLEDVLRYGQDVLRGIEELHLHGVLALNLKPCNMLLDERDVAVVGEFGIPMLYAGAATPSERAVWLGSPVYMAPEQWGANVRGPVASETDCWSFACSVVELLSGEAPWRGMASEEIFKAVVEKRETPRVPVGLPRSVERALKRCFEYDYRHRPSVKELLQIFTNPNEPFQVGDWVESGDVGVVKSLLGPDIVKVQFCDKLSERPHSALALLKDPFRVGDAVKLKLSVTTPRFGWPGGNVMDGTVSEVLTEDAVCVVTFLGSQQTWRADPAQLERVSGGLVPTDWVRSRRATGAVPSRVGVVHGVDHEGKVKVAFFGQETLWTGDAGDFEKVTAVRAGEYVRVRHEVAAPRFKWPVGECGEWDTGRVARVLPNGGLVVDFPGRLFNGRSWWADPEEVEVVRLHDLEGLLKKYQHVEKMHWAVRPAVSLLGFLVAVRTGVVLMNLVTRPFRGKKQAGDEGGVKGGEGSGDGGSKVRKEGASAVWLPSQVAAATSTVAGIMFGSER